MARTSVLVVAAVAIAGCKDPAPAPTPKACEAAAERVPWEAKVKRALAASCVELKWSAAVIECVAAATDLAGCAAKMTTDQRSSFERFVAAAEQAEAARAARAQAEAGAAKAAADAREAQATMMRLEEEATVLQKKVTDATDAIVGAQTKADRDAANAALDQLQREKADLDARIAAAKAAAARAVPDLGPP